MARAANTVGDHAPDSKLPRLLASNGWVVACLVVFLYVASVGPVVKFCNTRRVSPPVLEIIYAPLVLLYDYVPFSGPMLDAYISLWI